MNIKTTQNFMLISKPLRKCEKIANKKVMYRQNKCAELELFSY